MRSRAGRDEEAQSGVFNKGEDMVQIKAKDLKWTHWGFAFINKDGRADRYKHDRDDYIRSFYSQYGYDEVIQVNPEAYKNSVIAKIKEVFAEEDCVSMYKNTGSIFLQNFMDEEDDPYCEDFWVVEIKLDPMPWEEEYTIILGEE